MAPHASLVPIQDYEKFIPFKRVTMEQHKEFVAEIFREDRISEGCLNRLMHAFVYVNPQGDFQQLFHLLKDDHNGDIAELAVYLRDRVMMQSGIYDIPGLLLEVQECDSQSEVFHVHFVLLIISHTSYKHSILVFDIQWYTIDCQRC